MNQYLFLDENFPLKLLEVSTYFLNRWRDIVKIPITKYEETNATQVLGLKANIQIPNFTKFSLTRWVISVIPAYPQAPLSYQILTHCGLVTPYVDINLGQHWLR